ncbi:hypothetical protein B0T25DRAFT_340794 [Lasiosphaeria hispida]|uniref:Uncharacterized protein n=1 Tax=Lasiosphaeria hispida TaxID=260671 RepID=A0AAJ0H6T4_9PEZI|nr:hypothetical protein B0T25DRAFT_340794 [Lasiosphaeria hispida]
MKQTCRGVQWHNGACGTHQHPLHQSHTRLLRITNNKNRRSRYPYKTHTGIAELHVPIWLRYVSPHSSPEQAPPFLSVQPRRPYVCKSISSPAPRPYISARKPISAFPLVPFGRVGTQRSEKSGSLHQGYYIMVSLFLSLYGGCQAGTSYYTNTRSQRLRPDIMSVLRNPCQICHFSKPNRVMRALTLVHYQEKTSPPLPSQKSSPLADNQSAPFLLITFNLPSSRSLA